MRFLKTILICLLLLLLSAPPAFAAELSAGPTTGITTVKLDYTLVSPAFEFGERKVALGSVQLSDGSWVYISHEQQLTDPYYKLLRKETDSQGIEWYVVNTHAKKLGSFQTPDGSYPNELWLLASECTATDTITVETGDPRRIEVLKAALDKLGATYRYGGIGPDVFDCSGFVDYCMAVVGIGLPHSSSIIKNSGRQISMQELRPGDVCGRSGHVGIYLGNGTFMHAAQTASGVKSAYLEDYNRSDYFTNYADFIGD